MFSSTICFAYIAVEEVAGRYTEVLKKDDGPGDVYCLIDPKTVNLYLLPFAVVVNYNSMFCLCVKDFKAGNERGRHKPQRFRSH